MGGERTEGDVRGSVVTSLARTKDDDASDNEGALKDKNITMFELRPNQTLQQQKTDKPETQKTFENYCCFLCNKSFVINVTN